MTPEITLYQPATWPRRMRAGVLVLDRDTGVAVFVNSEPTAAQNQQLAEARLRQLLDQATAPGDWLR